jgi:hypothetical protein
MGADGFGNGKLFLITDQNMLPKPTIPSAVTMA